MKRTNILLSFVTLAVTFAGCTQQNQPISSASPSPAESVEAKRIASADVVKVVASPVTIEAGGTTEALVQLTIQSGYHVNANPPTFPYLKPTALEIPAAGTISLKTVAYPKALERKFAFAEEPLAVYEGQAELKATLKADKAATPGEQIVPALLRIQACDEQVCYPPGTLEFAISVSIK